MRRRIDRAVRVMLVPWLIALQLPLPVAGGQGMASPRTSAATADVASTAPPAQPEPRPLLGNRKVPKVTPPAARPVFSDPPSVAELFRARVFEEPLVPGGATATDENRALARALTTYLDAPTREDVAPLQAFLDHYADSTWRTSLLANLGIVAGRTGRLSRALRYYDEAWRTGRTASDPRVRALAERAVSELALLLAGLGRQDELSAILEELGDSALSGSSGERLSAARQGLWVMENRPQEAFRCGPVALGHVFWVLHGRHDERISNAPGTPQGTSLSQMRELAEAAGLQLRMGKRDDARVAFPVPAMVHMKVGHFTAILKRSGARYLVADPVFNEERWLSVEALQEESSGYVLAPTLPKGFKGVGEKEGGAVWGRGCPNEPDPGAQRKCDPTSGGGGCAQGGNCPLMADYTFLRMLAGLRIVDTPVSYSPPRGPFVDLTLTYNQREVFQPSVFPYVNVGRKWTFDPISYVEDDPAGGLQTIRLYRRGGGMEVYPDMPPGAGVQSAPHFQSRAILARTNTSPVVYRRRAPDGTVEFFQQADGALSFPRKFLLTQIRDPQENVVRYVYDNFLRLVAITDAIGQVTTLSYADESLTITRITDPFGRSATLTYDGEGRLSSITDVLGLTSSFTYGTADFITSMTTPYGTTRFSTGDTFVRRWIEAEDPLGGRERAEYVRPHDSTVGPRWLPAEEIPQAFQADPTSVPPFDGVNGNWDAGLTLFWDKRAMLLAPGLVSSAEITHWLESVPSHRPNGVMRAYKRPLESRVFYRFAGQSTSHANDGRPIAIGRFVHDGTSPPATPVTQLHQYGYNSRGKFIRYVDPSLRETRYTYGSESTPDPDQANGAGIDLLKVEQKNPAGPSGYDLLESTTYDANHRPLTVTDTSGQTTVYTYLPDGRLSTVVTPVRNGPNGVPLTVAERTTTYAYYPDGAPTGAGRVHTVTGPTTAQGSPLTTFTYDGYGRVRTTADVDNYTLTLDYDASDRLTRTTYPDGTYEETTYNKLDAEESRDRGGKRSYTIHDALRRVVAQRDAAGRTVTQDWCICGSLNRIVDANQNVTTWERDLQGRITKEIRADGAAWEYLYESRTSRLKERKDAKLQVTRYEYFTDDNPKQITYVSPLIPTPNVSYTYDTVYNRVATTVDGTGTTVYSYNPVSVPPTLGAARLASIDGPLNNDTVSYTYDELSRILNRGLPVTTTRFIYDALGRVVRQENPGTPVGEFISTYEGPTERLSSFQYPNGQLTEYTYFSNSGDHRLQEIKHLAPGGGVISKHNYSYDPVSNITAWTQQTGANPAQVYELGYDRADQLTSATLKTTAIPPATLKRYAYRYDPAGNRTSNQTDNSVLAAAHNSRNQLVSTQAGGALMFRGTVNEPATVTVQTQQADVTADNRFAGTAPTTSGTNTVTVTARDFSQPPNVRTNTYEVNVSGSSVTYTYDPNGNMTSDGIRTFEWDAENRLTAVRQGAITLATFAYDSLGRRSFKTAAGVTRTYIYDGDNVTVERISSGGRVRYVHGRGIDQPLAHHDDALAVTYYLADHLGSILHLTNAAGAIVLTREYDAWGTQIQGSTTSGYAFTGREWDSETSRYYYRARYYDPESGRFSSEDPMSLVRAFAMGNGTNLYSYVGSNPSNYGDAFGLARTPCLPSPLPSLPPPPAPKRCPLIFCRVMGRQSGQYYSCTLVMIGTNCKLALRPEPCSLYMHVPLCMPDMLSVQPKPYDPDSLDPPPSPPYPQPLEFKCETCPA